MSHWNHRVVRRIVGDETQLGIHETYYDDAGKVRAISSEPDGIVSDSIHGLQVQLGWMLKALDQPVLEYDQIPEPGAESF